MAIIEQKLIPGVNVVSNGEGVMAKRSKQTPKRRQPPYEPPPFSMANAVVLGLVIGLSVIVLVWMAL